jgi:prepilin peptidase CpaA
MGAGDSKYLFSLFLIIPSSWHMMAMYSLTICTLSIGVFSLLTTLAKNYEKIYYHLSVSEVKSAMSCFDRKFPFAPVIFISWLLLGAHLIYFSKYLAR